MFDQRAQALERRHRARVDLGRYRGTMHQARRTRERAAYLQAQAERTSKPMNPNRVQVQATNDGPEWLLCRIADMQLDTARLERRAENIYQVIDWRIKQVERPLYRRILEDFWIYDMTLEQIADGECYTVDWIKKLHGRALDEYAKILENKAPEDTHQGGIM